MDLQRMLVALVFFASILALPEAKFSTDYHTTRRTPLPEHNTQSTNEEKFQKNHTSNLTEIIPTDKTQEKRVSFGEANTTEINESVKTTEIHETLTTESNEKAESLPTTEIDLDDYFEYLKLFGMEYFISTKVFSNPDPRCPPIDPEFEGPYQCSYQCGYCFSGQICCPNNCKGTQCMFPVKPEDPKKDIKKDYYWKLFKKNSIPQYSRENDK